MNAVECLEETAPSDDARGDRAVLSSAPASAQERPVVFVHGIASSGSSWRDAADRLQATLDHARRGARPQCRRHSMKCRPISWSSRAATVGNDVVVIGHSNGGDRGAAVEPGSSRLGAGDGRHTAPGRADRAEPGQLRECRISSLLSSISDVYRAFGSACCNWQSLLTSYSLWWSLAYDLASSSILQIGASLGLTVAQPVLPEMVPGSSYLSGLNSPASLAARERRGAHTGRHRLGRPQFLLGRRVACGVSRPRRCRRLLARYRQAGYGLRRGIPVGSCGLRRLVSIRDRRHVVECVVFSVRDG